ncbi:folic acid synthesis protein-like protein [Phyllosticta paracitricarpa]|uniref:Folic acid synthesis protein-like protein n=2 Tax=Phyllosticta TaxID=121621 RepID=A0ABR1NIC1_9PEZI
MQTSARQCFKANCRPLHRTFSCVPRQSFQPHGFCARKSSTIFSSRLTAPMVSSRVCNHAFKRFQHGHAQSNKAFIALGSNMGDRISTIEKACRAMESHGDIRILRTSNLWETEPMYVEDQDKFLNGACEIETTLNPIQLLDRLQDIEIRLERNKTIDKGPRTIDLDILLYGNTCVSEPRLTIPHPLMREREFVLRPLCEMIPDAVLPGAGPESLSRYLAKLEPRSSEAISTVTPLSPTLPPIMALRRDRPTYVMAILNMTPDSFSDGGALQSNGPTSHPEGDGAHFSADANAVKRTVSETVGAGCTILDVGGQSTRPGAPEVSEAEEVRRVLSAIDLIRSMRLAAKAAISVDTYRASVAERAIQAGAHIVNDVSSGTMDPKLLPTVAKLGCTICLMHMRGTPQTMSSLTEYKDGIVAGVAEELKERIRIAEAAGIRRWRIILDPGFGFAKTLEQNLELLRRFNELRAWPGLEGFPWLIGTSRKRFIATASGVSNIRARDEPTIVTTAAAIQGGADIVRLHPSDGMMAPVRMADAIWRHAGRASSSTKQS